MANIIGDYKILQTIGSGTFGKVKKALHYPTNEFVAVKILQKRKILNRNDLTRINRQISILKQIQHQNIVKLLQIRQTQKCIYLITELVEGQQLYQKINAQESLSQEAAGEYFIQLLEAIEYLHERKICHRDIKPQNILIYNDRLKLIDFGLSTYYNDDKKLITSCGSPCYAAPEMLHRKRYNPEKSDVWAMGITLYAMLSGKLPFQHQNTNKLYKIISEGSYEEIQGISSSLKHLIRSMIEVNPDLRISLNEIKQNVWIKSYHKNHINMAHQSLNEDLLMHLAKNVFNLPINTLKQKICSSSPSKQKTYFFLMKNIRKHGQNSQNIQYYDGPIHFSCIFSSLQKVKQFIKELMPKGTWISQYQVISQNSSAKITKLRKGEHFYYLILNKQGQQELQKFVQSKSKVTLDINFK